MQEAQIRVQDAGQRLGRRKLRHGLSLGVALHGAPTDPKLTRNGAIARAASRELPNRVVTVRPPRASRLLACYLGRGAFLGAAAGEAIRQLTRQRLELPIPPPQHLFHGIAHVGQEVPAIRDLDRLRRTVRNAANILCPAVTRDQFHAGVGLQPVRHGGRRTVREESNRPMLLQIHNDGAIHAAFAQCPIVQANLTWW